MSVGIKRFLPRGIFGRSLMILVTPLVLLQVVSALIFYEAHWDRVSLRMARSVAGDIAFVIGLLKRFPEPANREWIFDLAAEHMEFVSAFNDGAVLPNAPVVHTDGLGPSLARAMEEYVGKPFRADTTSLEREAIVQVQLPDGVLEVVTTHKRIFSSTTYVFVLWMVGTSMILLGVATIFMRNQVRPIRRLAAAADAFGKGRDFSHFKPEGANEVRQAAAAFLDMSERLQRQIRQRTDMLAGVSHDLRTPLTRMKLQLAMLGHDEAVADLEQDVLEMEHMLEGYLAFARGEGTERPQPTDVNALLEDVVALARRKGGAVDLHCEQALEVPLRPSAFRRCMTNLLENAARYADHVSVRAGRRHDAVEITIDDDGPGIPADRREEVFKPFIRLEASRNPGTGGVGLGLAIARDVVRGHGGEIALDDSPTGGLRVRVQLPV